MAPDGEGKSRGQRSGDVLRQLAFGGHLDSLSAGPANRRPYLSSVVAEVRSQLSEVKKPWYASSDEHTNAVAKYLRGEVVAGWEHREAVIARIAQLKLGFASLDRVALVTHGLFITTLLHQDIGLNDPFSFWSNLRMPDAWEFDLDEKSFGRIP